MGPSRGRTGREGESQYSGELTSERKDSSTADAPLTEYLTNPNERCRMARSAKDGLQTKKERRGGTEERYGEMWADTRDDLLGALA